MSEDITTIKQGIAELTQMAEKFAGDANTKQFMTLTARVLDGLNYKLLKLEREVQPSDAFIDPNASPTRLR